jgi:RNA polymerase sigma-70 factor (ECF subfamily)
VTNADVINQAAGGDHQSIEQICRTEWEPLYRFIYYKVQNREEAEDVTQETFVRALTCWRTQKPDVANWSGYLKKIAFNIIRDRWRQKQRRGIMIDFESINPGDIITADEQKIIIQRVQIENALALLSEDHRKILDLRILKGHSVAEAAALTGKTQATVRTTQYRALKALAKILKEND